MSSWLKPKSRKEHEELEESLAKQAFAEHGVQSQSGAVGPWMLKAPGNSYYWIEVICTRDRGIFVHGDISPILFTAGGALDEPKDRIAWLANSNLSYVYEKARLGMMDNAPTRHVAEVAYHELLEYQREYHDSPQGHLDAIEEAIGLLKSGEHLTFAQHALYDAGMDSEFVGGLGQVTPSSVIYAWYGVRRLAEILGVLREQTRLGNGT
jgi:hypothetical protein